MAPNTRNPLATTGKADGVGRLVILGICFNNLLGIRGIQSSLIREIQGRTRSRKQLSYQNWIKKVNLTINVLFALFK